MIINNTRDAFQRASSAWQDEVNTVAAQLLKSGEASSPGEAMAKAEKIVQERRRAESTDLIKRFDAGGPIIAGHGV